MPTAVTHQLLAEEVYRSLPQNRREEIISLPHYYLGAQGCDVCFFYKILSSEQNFGRFLHASNPLPFFKILFEESKTDQTVRSYAYGYLTHYAADTVFHAYVYGRIKGEDRLLHHAIEHAYDGELLKRYGRGENLSLYRLPKEDALSLEGVYKVYARYARASGWGELEKEDFFKAVRRYYAFASWRTPLFRKKYAERAEELFLCSKERSLRLIKTFSASKTGKFTSQAFQKSYLNGKITQKKEKKAKNTQKID